MNPEVTEPCVETIDATLTAAGLPISSTMWVTSANAVMAAYNAYNNGQNNKPTLPGYHGFISIYAYEVDPNGNPFTLAKADAVVSVPVGATAPSPGYQLFGFAAVADDLSHNIVALRGTVTLEESGYDLMGWGDNTQCKLPSANPTKNYGNVKKDLYDFYMSSDFKLVTSLAKSFNAAVKSVALSNPNKPFVVTAHSLGGALATLGALDGYVSGSFGGNPPVMITFGSLHLGDASFKQNFEANVFAMRIANLCDFVPSFVALEPGPPTSYVHVGTECTFVWQKWDDWANHSMEFTYLPTVQTYSSVIQVGPRKYPQ